MCMSYIGSLDSTIQRSLVCVSFLSSLLFIGNDRSCNVVIFNIDIIIDTLSGSFLAQLCLTRGHLEKVSSDI